MNTLPYFIVGNPNIKSAAELRARPRPCNSAHRPTSRSASRSTGWAWLTRTSRRPIGGGPARLTATMTGQTDFTVVTEGEKIRRRKTG